MSVVSSKVNAATTSSSTAPSWPGSRTVRKRRWAPPPMNGCNERRSNGACRAVERFGERGEHRFEHLRRQGAGVGVEPRAVIAIGEQHPVGQSVHGGMAERVGGAA